MSAPKVHSLDELLSNYERTLIMITLQRNKWNRRLAAEALLISERRLFYRLRALHFDTKAIPRDAPGRRRSKVFPAADMKVS
jgi:DNA-binding NtrC family response regulator